MSIYRDAFKRARQEGKGDFQKLPWEESEQPAGSPAKRKTAELPIPDILKELPINVFTDFQIIAENIHSRLMDKPLRVIGVTSPTPFQGVSTCSAVTASMLAMGKRNGYAKILPDENLEEWLSMMQASSGYTKVILLDAQIRHPVQHELFQLPNHQGLIQVISDAIPLEEVIIDTDLASLKLIPLGKKQRFQLALGYLENFHQLLDNLQPHYQYIVLDIPPILNFAEGLAISKLCDGVILVVRAGHTRWEVVQEAKRLLQKAGVYIVGGVLNQRKFFIPNWLYKRL